MKPLDNDLKNLLRRREPAEGFADRVMARLDTPAPRHTFIQRWSAVFRSPTFRWVAVATACVAAVLGVARYEHEQRARAQAEQASQQALYALRITNEEINTALRRAQNATLRALEFPRNSNSEME